MPIPEVLRDLLVASSASGGAARTELRQAAQRGALIGLAAATLVLVPAENARRSAAVAPSVPFASADAPAPPRPQFADFGAQRASRDARHVANWVADSRDNAGADFIVLDKRGATLYVFDATARLRGATPVLLGYARGDDSVAGIGTRPIAEVRPHERTTPAGRFLAERGRNAIGEDVVWVDYDAAVSIHPVRVTEPKERRLQRLASRTIADNRVSYGCINVPAAFFDAVIRPNVIVAGRRTVVYVLPETRPVQHVFGSYDVATAHATAPGRGGNTRLAAAAWR